MRRAFEQRFGGDGGNIAYVYKTCFSVSGRQEQLIVFLNIESMRRAKVLHKKTWAQKSERNADLFEIPLDFMVRRENVELCALPREKSVVVSSPVPSQVRIAAESKGEKVLGFTSTKRSTRSQ